MKLNLLFALLIVANCNIGHAQQNTTSTSISTHTSTTEAGKNYAEAETKSAFAFSSTFKKDLYSKINSIILAQYPKFDGHREIYKENGIEYKIELKETSVKLAFKTDTNEKDAQMAKGKIKSLAAQIKALNASK